MDRKTLERNYQKSNGTPKAAELERNYQKSGMDRLAQAMQSAILNTAPSPSKQQDAASAGVSSRKQSDIMKEQLDAIKARRDNAAIKAGAYRRAGNMTEQAKEQQEAANKAAIEYGNAYTQWKNQRNAEAVEGYNPDDNKFKAGDMVLAGVQNAFQSAGQYAAAASSYLSGNPEAQAWEAKRLMESGVSGTEAVKRSGLADKREIPVTDYKTQAELRHEKNVESTSGLERLALQTGNTIFNMVPSLAANFVLPGAGLPMMAASAAGNKYVDAYEKYGNTDMAFALGSAAGAASMLTEQLGGVYGKLGETAAGKAVAKKLMTEAPGLYSVANSVGGKWLRDAISEGVEEGAEDIVNYAIEKSLTGESDEMDNIGYDMLLGALAGGVLGGGNAAMRSITYNRLGKALNASPTAVAQQVQEGMEKGTGTAPAIYAAEVQKNTSNQMVGRLYEANLTYDAESGLSKIQNDITQVSAKEIKAMVSKADALAQAAQKLNVEATPQAVATAITDIQRTQSIKTAEDSVEKAFAPTIDNPANAGEKAYNSALAGVAANQGVAARINNDPVARQAFSQLTGVQFTDNPAVDIAAIEVATQNIAKSGKQAISKEEYAQRVAAAGEQAAAQFDADMQAQAERMQQESMDRWLSVEQNTITDVDGKRHIKEITNTDVRGNTEIGYKKAEILGSKKKAVAEVNNAAKYLGKTIVWFEGAVQVNGQYRLTNGYRAPDGTIYVNINSRDPLMVTFGHEMFHDLVADSKYSGLIDTLVENPDYSDMVNGMMNAKTELYERNGIELDQNAAAEEVAADISGDLLGSREMLEYIGARNTEAATGIKGFLNRILKKLKGKPSAEEAYNRLSEAQRALIDGMEGRTGDVTAETDARYSIYESYADDISQWVRDGKPNGMVFVLGNTGPVLQGLGAVESDIYLTSDKLNVIQKDHPEVSDSTIKKIPQILEDPILILRSNGHGKSGSNSRMVVIGAVKADNGQPLLTILDLRPYEKGFLVDDMQKVNSAYTKKNPENFIRGSEIVYADKNRTVPLLRRIGLTIASRELQQSGSIGRITYNGNGVNISGVPFSDIVSTNNYSMQNSAEDAGGSYSLMDDHRGNGYDGYSMSNNARAAYENGEKPLSNWTKTDIIDAIQDINPDIDCSRLNAATLKKEFLTQTSWHHTSKFYNRTNFYSIDTEYVEGLTQSEVDAIKNVTEPKKVRNASVDASVDDSYSKIQAIVEAGFAKNEDSAVKKLLRGGSLDAAYREAVDTIRERDAKKVDAWRKLPEGHWRKKYVSLYDSDIASYIREMYAANKLSKNSKLFKSLEKHFNDGGKFSLMDAPAMDSEYFAAVEGGNMKEAQRLVDEAAKENGYTIKAFHGTSRGDRVGNVFLPERATSGPMAFFTDNREIAERYSRDKADTSLAYDEEYSDYYTQFRVTRNGKSLSVGDLWKYLPMTERAKIKDAAPHIRFDEDYDKVIYDPAAQHGNGAYDAYELNRNKGNVLNTLVSTWLETGDLYNREADFLDVLKLAGLNGVEYRDPDARHEKVYETYLKIRNPFDASNVEQAFYDGLSAWLKSTDISKYQKGSAGADTWDKNNVDPEQFLKRVSSDIEAGTSHAWTSIPDYVTAYLKELGHDGIKDTGGKGGGESHTVWIPFSSEQVKSAEPIVRDDAGNVIPLSERFNSSNNDIRYSLMEDAQYMADIDRIVSEATEKANDDLKAAQAEAKNIRQQLADYRQQATAEAKMTAAWKEGETKLIADLSEAQSKEEKARVLSSYMDEYNALSERYRGEVRATDTKALTQYNEELSNLRSGFRGEMEKLAIEQGSFKRGEKAARDIYVPTSVNGKKVTRGTRTILEASQTPESMLEEHAKEILAGARGYEVISDKKAQEYAERIIDKDGYDKADELFTNAVNGDQALDKKTLVLGEYLYMEAAKAGDVKNAMRYAADVAAAATRAGQVVQAMRVLKKATPTGKLYYLNRMVDTMNKNIVDNGGDPIQIDEGLARKLLEAENIKDPKEQGKSVDETIDEIEQNIADQIPATAWDKWNAWRYLSMLGNIRTQVRNVVGNAAFMPLVATKNLLAAGMEKAFIRNGGRTKSSFFTKTNVGKRLMEFGKKDFETVVDEIQGGGKYNQSNSIEEKRTIFKSKAIEGWRKLTNKAMDKGDEIFSKHHYARALAGYLYANHLDYDKITRNTSQAQEVLNKARAYAILEAQKATFRDANQLASWTNKTKRNLLKKAQTAETKGAKAGWYAGTAIAEGIMPFTKTPIDIAVRGVEYSPIGLIKGIKEAVYDVKKGNKTAAEAIDTLSAGLTGTGIFALGYFMQSLGFLAGALGSDKDDKYKKDSGAQGFALHIGDKYYTIDWLAPFSLPLFTGAAVAETVENGDEVSFATLADALSTISEPMLEMSMLQGLNAALSSGKYGSESAIASFVTTNGLSYFAQANPTILGQIARAVDDTSRNAYYYDPNYKGFVKQGKVFVDKQLAKVPFASKALTSRIDLWGNKQKNTGGSFFGRLAYNMLSPGYYSEESSDPVDVALTKLYEETEDTAVLPSKPKKSFKNNKTTYKMNAKQYEEFCIVEGQTAHKEIQSFINSAEYKKMSNEDRVGVLDRLYTYSAYKAQKNLLGDKYVTPPTYGPYVKAEAYAKGGNPVYKYFLKG